MARIDTLANFVTDICDAVRAKTGKTDKITPANLDTEIADIKTGEDLDAELQTYNTELSEQTALIQTISDKIKTKIALGTPPKIGYVVSEWDEEGFPLTIIFHGYTKIPNGLFYYVVPNTQTYGHITSARLKNVIIEDTTTEIGNFAFQANPDLTSVKMSDNVKTLGTQIFYNCTNLESVVLSNTLTKINNYDFYGCSKFNINKLPDALKIVGTNAFENCSNLALTELPNGLTEIMARGFYGCTKLAISEIPETVKTIGGSAFYNCKNLAISELPETVTSWGSSAFQNSGIAIKTLPSTFGKSITQIPSYFVAGCKNITDFAFPVINPNYGEFFQIMSNAFADCTNLTMESFPKGVYAVLDKAFFNCTSLDVPELEVNNWNGNTANWTGQYAFSNTGLTKVHLKGGYRQPSGSSVKSHMFANCLKLFS